MSSNSEVTKYVVWFGAVHLLLLVALTILFAALDIDPGVGASIGALFGAAAVAVSRFIQDHKRVPNRKEKIKLVWFSYLASWVVSSILLGASVGLTGGGAELIATFSSIPMVVIIGILVFVSVFYLGALALVYGSMAEKQLAAMQKKGKI